MDEEMVETSGDKWDEVIATVWEDVPLSQGKAQKWAAKINATISVTHHCCVYFIDVPHNDPTTHTLLMIFH